MNEYVFDYDRLGVYRISIEYNVDAFNGCQSFGGLHGQARDQWLRAAQSIPLNIAEGNGKCILRDHDIQTARGNY
ncbi:MAG: four helix bundle protein [Planctomycetota bacterium]|nr:four helix bundle protein [Planctomycetota bacterium]